jgi:hypothetical protein
VNDNEKDLMAERPTTELRVLVPTEIIGAIDLVAERLGLSRTAMVNKWIAREIEGEVATARRLVNLMNAPHGRTVPGNEPVSNPSRLEGDHS